MHVRDLGAGWGGFLIFFAPLPEIAATSPNALRQIVFLWRMLRHYRKLPQHPPQRNGGGWLAGGGVAALRQFRRGRHE